MKKIMSSIVLFTMGMTLDALNPSIQFPPHLGETSEKEFGLEYHQPVSAINDGTVSYVIVQGNYKINGKNIQVPLKVSNHMGELGERVTGFRGNMQFLPSVTIDEARVYLENAKLERVEEKQGVYDAYYQVQEDVMGDKKEIKLSSYRSGRIYQCPMAHMIKVGDHVKTSFISLESEPVCYGLSAKRCADSKQQAYVHKNNTYPVAGEHDKVTVAHLGDKVLSTKYTHSVAGQSGQKLDPTLLKYCTHGKVSGEIMPLMISDTTAQIPEESPLVWHVLKGNNNESHLYTYKHYAECGDKVLNSVSLQVDSEEVFLTGKGAHRVGFKTKEKEAHKDDQGNVIIPPLYATKITQEDDKNVCITCMYGDPRDKENILVLQASLDVPAERCYLYGKDAANSRDYNAMPLKDKFVINKEITVVSRTDSKTEAPVAVYVIPPTNVGK